MVRKVVQLVDSRFCLAKDRFSQLLSIPRRMPIHHAMRTYQVLFLKSSAQISIHVNCALFIRSIFPS
ncbi:hypothetical protein DTO027B9_1486 [Paecilomyces variotii]|nr:hypothetical protein DTO027B9_1486 [Paecilomyces variotii]KAJ9404373.1 hypothetical protein DTO045G8_7856 [Paecilomyces variotii]